MVVWWYLLPVQLQSQLKVLLLVFVNAHISYDLKQEVQ